jgi:hypothetical protein
MKNTLIHAFLRDNSEDGALEATQAWGGSVSLKVLEKRAHK